MFLAAKSPCRTFLDDKYLIPLATWNDQHNKSVVVKYLLPPSQYPVDCTELFDISIVVVPRFFQDTLHIFHF